MFHLSRKLPTLSTLCPRPQLVQQQVRSLYQVPLREMIFLFQHVHKFPKLSPAMPTSDIISVLFSEMQKFAEQTVAPIDSISDSIGATLISDTNPPSVKTPKGFKEAYEQFMSAGWQGLSFPEKFSGQGLPTSLSLIQTEMLASACWTWLMFPGLSKGAINTLMVHGNDILKEKYLADLISSKSTGTMCLTEPQCGSDLAQVATKAVPVENKSTASSGIGSLKQYKISGTKIFISCGEHDLTENILHLVLARLPDAPSGTRGISLFLVPKFLSADDASGSEKLTRNKVAVSRLEEKMGCHGSPTCELIFDEAIGYLVGEENKGLNHMFTYINTSRIGTAIQGLAAMQKGLQFSTDYALQRKAMVSLANMSKPKGPTGKYEPDLIIEHPSVRQMLLTQKVFAEGCRSMIYQCALLEDLKQAAMAENKDKKAKEIEDKLGFLTPILKGFITEQGIESSNLAIQVFGGHGYIKSNLVEQNARDVRISSVWEGTTQIQALDLLARKIVLQKFKPLLSYSTSALSELTSLFMSNLKQGNVATCWRILKVSKSVMDLNLATATIAVKAARNRNYIGIASEKYLMYCGYLQLALHWVKIESTANKLSGYSGVKKQEDKIDGFDLEGKDLKRFCDSKIITSKYFFENLYPRMKSLRKGMMASEKSVMGLKNDEFLFRD